MMRFTAMLSLTKLALTTGRSTGRRAAFLLWFAPLFAAVAPAQTVHWEADPGAGAALPEHPAQSSTRARSRHR